MDCGDEFFCLSVSEEVSVVVDGIICFNRIIVDFHRNLEI